jgi:hypothetical protein
MMILPGKTVESFAKIAMTALLRCRTAMRLLRNRDPPRRILFDVAQIPKSGKGFDLNIASNEQSNVQVIGKFSARYKTAEGVVWPAPGLSRDAQ